MKHNHSKSKDSLSLWGAVSMGTGVMIGAGIFALTGQIAKLAGTWFPLAFLAAAMIAGFSAYSYVKMAQAYPSAGGIAMFLKKAYGKTLMTGACALLILVVLGAFVWVKIQSDMFVIWASLIGLVLVFVGEKFFLKVHEADEDDPNYNDPQAASS